MAPIRFDDTDDLIDIRFDNVFKAVFTRNTPASQGALSKLISAEYYDPAHRVSLNGRSRITTVELSKLDRVVEKPAKDMNAQEHWAIFFRYLPDKAKRGKINEIIECEEGIAMASEVLMTISKDEVERARLMSEYKYQLDTQSKLVHAKREGRQEGLQTGRQEEKWEIARKMKSRGITAEQIAEDTGLTLKQVEDL